MKKIRFPKNIFSVFMLCIAFGACNKNNNPKGDYQPVFVPDTSKQKTIVMGLASFSYSETAAPMVQYLNAHLSGAKIKVHACVDWREYNELLNQKQFDITIINGIVSCEAAKKGYSIYGKATSDTPNSSLIIIAKNSGINKVSDLKGKKLAVAASNRIPSSMLGMYYLYQNGLDVNLSVRKIDITSFEAGIISVYLGESDAAICPRRNWNVYVRDHPEILSKVEIKWETPAIDHNAILIKNTVEKKKIAQLINLFFSMNKTTEGKAALEKLDYNGFEKANNNTYKSMLDFKKKYDAVIF